MCVVVVDCVVVCVQAAYYCTADAGVFQRRSEATPAHGQRLLSTPTAAAAPTSTLSTTTRLRWRRWLSAAKQPTILLKMCFFVPFCDSKLIFICCLNNHARGKQCNQRTNDTHVNWVRLNNQWRHRFRHLFSSNSTASTARTWASPQKCVRAT